MVDLNLNPSLSPGRSIGATGRMFAPELKSEFDAALTNAGDTQAVGTVSRDPAIAPSSNALERDEFVGLDKRQEGELPTGSSDMALITNSTHEKMEGLTLGGALHGTPHISIADFNEMDVSPRDSSLEAVAATGVENEQAMDDGVDEVRFEPQAAVLEPLLKPT